MGNLGETEQIVRHECGPDLRNTVIRQSNAFTTGSAAGGYTLGSVTVKIKLKRPAAPGSLSAAIYANSNGNGNGSPTGSALITLTAASDNPTGAGNHTYTCSTSCALTKDTTYHLVLSAPNAPDNADYQWSTTESDDETKAPTTNGWSIANTTKYNNGGSWTREAKAGPACSR